jgi:hypothetical protein
MFAQQSVSIGRLHRSNLRPPANTIELLTPRSRRSGYRADRAPGHDSRTFHFRCSSAALAPLASPRTEQTQPSTTAKDQPGLQSHTSSTHRVAFEPDTILWICKLQILQWHGCRNASNGVAPCTRPHCRDTGLIVRLYMMGCKPDSNRNGRAGGTRGRRGPVVGKRCP